MKYEDFKNVPEKVNVTELREELRAIGVEKAIVCSPVTWTKVGDDGAETIESEPAKIQALLPKGVSREQVEEVLKAHNPKQSTDEVHRENIQKRDDERLQSQPLVQKILADLTAVSERLDLLDKKVTALQGK